MKWFALAMALFIVQIQPGISVTPTSGETGGQIVVAGTGFPAGERVKVSWDGANLGGTVRVGQGGTFEYTGTVPDAAPGSHVVAAAAVGGGTVSATATFTVVAATSTTSTSSSSTSTTSTPTSTTAASNTQVATPATTAAPAAASTPTSAPSATTSSAAGSATDGGNGDTPTTSGGAEPLTAPAPVATTQPSEQRSQPSGGGGGLLLAALLVLVVGASVAFLLAGRSRSEDRSRARVAAEPPVTDEEPGPADLSPVAPSQVAGRQNGWQRQMLEIAPTGDLAGMLQVGDRVFGWGTSADAGREVARVWTSADAVHWTGGATLGAVRAPNAVGWRDGLLISAVAEDEGGASTRCWWSADGVAWEDMGDVGDLSLSGVLLGGAAAGHMTLIGWGRGPNGPGLWVSDDAASWHPSGIAGTFDLVAPTQSGFVAFGRDPEHRRAIVAHSSDGESWTRSGEETQYLFDGSTVATLTSVDGGMVAAGTDIMRGVPAIWVSDDGVAWHRVPLDEAAGTSIEFIAAAGDRLIAVGSDTGRRMSGRGTVIVWESSDVVTWNRVDAGELFRSAAIDAVALVDGSLAACGTLFVDRERGPAEPVPVGWAWHPTPARSTNEPVGALA